MDTSYVKKGFLIISIASSLAACGGNDGSGLTQYNRYDPGINATCIPGMNVKGNWRMVANNSILAPDTPFQYFFSYNQPSINSNGVITFRGRAKSPSGSSGGVQQGVYASNACAASTLIYTVADNVDTLVPDPNNTGVFFTEFPSIPRIDMNTGIVATRGMSQPVWTYIDPITSSSTKIGTSGLYITLPSGLTTGMNSLGGVPDYSAIMQVPNTAAGTKFDQFPGSPAVDGNFMVTKGNFTDTTLTGQTGVYFRDMSNLNNAIQLIADTSTVIPGQTPVSGVPATTFGSTAPPSAANGNVVFTGLDNENAPTMGGIYSAPLQANPALTTIIKIGDAVVDSSGIPLTDGSTFTQFGEGLSFDGRYVSFWGAWGTATQTRAVNCPTDGNADMKAACQSQTNNTGSANMTEPANQGIFVYDTQTKNLWMAASTYDSTSNPNGQFQDFLYWVFSGNPNTSDGEPPRFRSSAFAAVDGNRGVVFAGSLSASGIATPGKFGASAPKSGIYGSALTASGMGPVFKVIAIGDDMALLDPAAPTASSITSLGIERESLRKGWLALTASSLNTSSESWAGLYVTYLTPPFTFSSVPDLYGMYSLVLQ